MNIAYIFSQKCENSFFFTMWNAVQHKLIPDLHLVIFLSLQSFEQDGRSSDADRGQIQKAASSIISALSKRHNSTVMMAVVEVKVEMPVEPPPVGESHIPDLYMKII